MNINTSISRCLIEDFKAYEKINENTCKLSWGKEDELKLVRANNKDSNAKDSYEPTGVCTYESGIYKGILTPFLLDINVLNKSERYASLKELREIYTGIGLNDDEQVVYLKDALKKEILRYDKSNAVEGFIINDSEIWLDKETRTGLLLRFQAEKASGKTNTILWYEGIQFPLLIDEGIQMLYAIEVYASATYDKKESLLSEVDKLSSIDELLLFDYKSGYPTKLAF